MISADFDVASELFPDLLTVGDMAEVMATNVETVERWIAERQVSCIRVAGEVRFLPEVVKKFVVEHQELYGTE